MQRSLFIGVTGPVPPVTFGVNVNPPAPTGTRWEVQRVVVKLANWKSGIVVAMTMLDGRDYFGSQQGQNDTATGAGFIVYASSILRVEWRPMPNVQTTDGLGLRASARIDVNQVEDKV